MRSTLRFRLVLLAGVLGAVGCQANSDKTPAAQNEGPSATSKEAFSAMATGAPPTDPVKICTPSDLTSCANQNLATDACLTLYQACGRYLEIIEHYKSEDFNNDPNKAYYLGASYYGLFLQNRSIAAKCMFGTAARYSLLEYLNKSFQNQGYNDQRIFQQTYHATRLLANVDKIDGCSQDSITQPELYNATYRHGKELAETLFLGNPPAGPLGATLASTKVNIQTAVQGFITLASDIQTQIALRKVAMDEADARILTIAHGSATMAGLDGFGATVAMSPPNGPKPVVSGVGLPGDGLFTTAEWMYESNKSPPVTPPVPTSPRADTDALFAKIQAALGTTDMAIYEQRRAKILKFAADAAAAATTASQRATMATKPDLITAIQGSLNANPTDDGSKTFTDVKNGWLAYGKTIGACTRTTVPWYCK